MLKNALIGLFSSLCFIGASEAQTVRVATFNVSMEATNYVKTNPSLDTLKSVLSNGDNQQVKNIAEIIQIVKPDIVLLNEFDYIPEPNLGINAFVKHYLNVSQNGNPAIDYPYFYIAPVNTGVSSGVDLDNDGNASGKGADAYGFGLYPGQYGMAVLSRYPIDIQNVRSFQQFKWKDMPKPSIPRYADGKPWYSEAAWDVFRLSSKSHWDIPVMVDGEAIHILAMHPTPPVFDGEEDRNGKRNQDEIRMFADYIDGNGDAYLYDDNGKTGNLAANSRFVLVGDFNAADIGPRYRPNAIELLTNSSLVNNTLIPLSPGGAQNDEAEYSSRYTAYWGARADYVLPSKVGLKPIDGGVFWPAKEEALHRLVATRADSSDHRLVWLDLAITPIEP